MPPGNQAYVVQNLMCSNAYYTFSVGLICTCCLCVYVDALAVEKVDCQVGSDVCSAKQARPLG